MANSNRVFVSPGVYTSEKDLTFVAQSIGVTTLGLVGETLKGPAFEPILISNFDEFKTYFGPTSPEKDGGGNPKYELGYVAKSYLQESNQLFVTRVLGKTGYKAGKTFGIKTIGGISVDLEQTPSSTTGITTPTAEDIVNPTYSTFYSSLSGKTNSTGTTVTNYIVTNYGSGLSTGDWFTIGNVPSSATSGLTGNQKTSPIGTATIKNWNNVFTNTNGTEVYGYLFVYAASSMNFTTTKYTYTATSVYDNEIVIAALRSRGNYSQESLTFEVTGNTSFTISGSTLTSDPLSEFNIYVTGTTGAKVFTCSLDSTSPKYITKVLGTSPYDKDGNDVPLYVHEVYPNLTKNLYNQGLIRGLSLTEVYNAEGDNFSNTWDTPKSPTVVSEVRGGKVDDLFDVITISDGNAANQEIKITIQNINIETGEFDILVRDFNDSDENMVVLEKFSRCSMNPDVAGYVARKIGTSTGEYTLNSKYIMLLMDSNAPSNAFPAGFKGFTNATLSGSTTLGSVLYKTEFFDSGETIYGDTTSNGDKFRKTSLGLSSDSNFSFDADLFKYKGSGTLESTDGFHLSIHAATITGNTVSGYMYQTTPYDLEGTDKGKLDSINYRKFTFAVCGGFDGWDIYRQVRTYGDGYIFGKLTYISGLTTNGGLFDTANGNSDYYAYLEGINTYANPEAIDINVFATPGINFYDHSSLTTQAIDMIETDRADSIYIIGAPNETDATNVIDDLDGIAVDSNYSATYWPWIQVRDTDNATQLYIPPTGEVVKNIALTDNVSYPWFAVAGYSRGLVNAIKAQKKLTLDERDELYKARINPIATFSDTGTIIWGNKTLQVRESALDRINVRRLLLRARKLISAVAVRLLFEQNDDQVRQEFLRLVNPILESIKKERGLYDFRVSVSNDPEDIDANTLRGKIYIKPTRSLEFIDLEFVITPTGASFDNI
jgi:hypothetical protein